jgi:hypothetical protein
VPDRHWVRATVPVLGALLAGCTGSSAAPGTNNPSPTLTPSVSVSASASLSVSASPSPVATGTATSAVGAPPCLTSGLKLSIGDHGGTAGTNYEALVLTNIGTADCGLYGYPGVSFVDNSGSQVGLPATRDAGSPHLVVLRPGDPASALLGIPNAGIVQPAQCQPATATRIRVFPPGQTTALFLTQRNTICTTQHGRTHVGFLKPGTTGL